MKVSTNNPPYRVREKCEEVFDLTDIVPIFAFGDTIYNPHGAHVDPILIAHETVHQHQQGEDPKQWWDDYLEYPKFRFRQELQAYRVQYRFIKKTVKDRNTVAKLLHMIATDLSGEMYGGMCSHSEAIKMIKK